MDINIKEFSSLTNIELYEILMLRNEVFVVEQECSYDDIDGNDQDARHLFIKANDHIVACCRILNPEVTFDTYAIGRIVTKKPYRKNGYGKELINCAIRYIFRDYNSENVKISAQVYLSDFYKSFGFVPISDIYLEDGIPHQDMELLRKDYKG